jgi:crossover junction endodeoxyribonuclease RuvC
LLPAKYAAPVEDVDATASADRFAALAASFSCYTLRKIMRVLGIDCGGEYTGYGVVEQDDAGTLYHLCSGAIRLASREPLELRLKKISDALEEIIASHAPELVAIEDVFYALNVKSALKLGHIRGVAMLAAAQAGLPVVAYSPLSIKSAVVGYGRAEKAQVQIMVARLLNLPALPEPPDVADALAIAVCHLHTAATLRRQHAGARS